MSNAPPSSAVAEVWPVWTDFQDNWRAVDAHWLRARVVNVFNDAAARTAALTGQASMLVPGSLSYLQDVDSLEMYKSNSTWESVRYPNLIVTQSANQVLLRYVSTAGVAAGSGVILDNTGTATIEKLAVGLWATPTILANISGLTIKTGAKTVLLATDATSLTINSPVTVTGALSASGALSAPSAALTGALTAATATTTGQLRGATVVADGQSSGATGLFGTIALLSNKSGYAALQHNSQSTGTASGVFVGSDGSISINAAPGATNYVNGPMNLASAASTLTANGYVAIKGGGELSPAGSSAVALAGLIVVGGRGPNTSDLQPNGTIWVQV